MSHTVTQHSNTFLKVTSKNPCPICGKDHWCRVSDDGCHECHWIKTNDVAGFKRVGITGGGFGLYRQIDDTMQPIRPATRNGKAPTYATPEAAVDAMGKWKQFQGANHAGTWEYRKADGSVSFVVVRFDMPNGSKQCRPISRVGDQWKLGDPPGKLPLYGLAELGESERVYVVEGEKCADKARELGLTATTSSHGSSSAAKTDWSPLAGREVVILPDNDRPGRGYAESAARILTRLNPPATVRVVGLPGLPDGGDIVEFVDAQSDSVDVGELVDEMAERVSIWKPGKEEPPTDSLPEDVGPPWNTIAEIGGRDSYEAGLLPVTTGFATFDEVLRGGLRPESTYVLAGRTGSSKSTLTLNIARKVALSGMPVLIFKLEESPMEAVWRIHAAAGQVPLNALLDGAKNAQGDDRGRLDDGWNMIRSLPIRVSDARNIGAITRISRQHVEEAGKLIIVDQLSMVEVPDADTAYERVTATSNQLRRLARDLHVPILIVAQINRQAARGKDNLSCNDLRDSGAVENDAAAVILINKIRKPDGSQWGAAEPVRHLDILLGKNRYGPRTDPDRPLTLTWWPVISRIEDPERRQNGDHQSEQTHPRP